MKKDEKKMTNNRRQKNMKAPDIKKLIEVRAPMSGVFYRKPSPDDAAYVEVGDTVKKKQVLGLLETMKVYQKIKCPVNGRIIDISAENESPLKDNDLIFVIEES
jgi:acetyl-CoA carboxylase biotin carboxyl carrier protein